MEVQNASIFQNIVNQPKPLLSIKETCLLETQASSQKLMGLLLALSVMSALSSEIDCKFQTLGLKTNWLTCLIEIPLLSLPSISESSERKQLFREENSSSSRAMHYERTSHRTKWKLMILEYSLSQKLHNFINKFFRFKDQEKWKCKSIKKSLTLIYHQILCRILCYVTSSVLSYVTRGAH